MSPIFDQEPECGAHGRAPLGTVNNYKVAMRPGIWDIHPEIGRLLAAGFSTSILNNY
jgi:hypothetical protein